MTALHRTKTRWGWGVLDDNGFRLEESPYDARHGTPFKLCDVGDLAIAMLDQPPAPEVRTRAADLLPAWIHAVAYAARVSPPDAVIGRLDVELIVPASFDRCVLAFAAAVTLMSEGMFERYPDRYEVRVAGESLAFSMDQNDDDDFWSAIFVD